MPASRPWQVHVVALAAGLYVAAGAAPVRGETAGVPPGAVLDATTWQRAEGLLPPEILRHYRTGEYANRIVDWPANTFNWPPDFLAGSKANEGRFVVGPAGQILDRTTGAQTPFIVGFPFPTIDPKEADAGLKIVWNYFYLYWYWGNLHAQAQLNFVGPQGLERRTDQDVNYIYYDGVPVPDRLPNPQNFSTQQLIAVRAPADLNGTAALTWRYRDPEKRDSAWTYVPALRRVRAVSPANRSDGFLGSDFSQDDGYFFDGKPEDFTWKLTGEVDQYRIVDPLNLEGKSRAEWIPTGGWRAFWPDMAYLGYQDPKWKGVGWAPVGMALARRPFWVVEGVPKDKYYLYGRLELYIDRETFQGAWDRKFSWKGELLTTYQAIAWNPQPSTRPDGRIDYLQASNMNYQCAENIKANRATVAGQKWNPNAALDYRVPYDPGFFDTSSLARFGK